MTEIGSEEINQQVLRQLHIQMDIMNPIIFDRIELPFSQEQIKKWDHFNYNS